MVACDLIRLALMLALALIAAANLPVVLAPVIAAVATAAATPYLPSVAATERSFSTRDRYLFLRRYWRGPTWVNSAWLVWLGLLRLGYADEAAVLSRRLLEAIAREGLREYYHPRTGKGMGARDFAWSALVSELVAADPRATTSYL